MNHLLRLATIATLLGLAIARPGQLSLVRPAGGPEGPRSDLTAESSAATPAAGSPRLLGESAAPSHRPATPASRSGSLADGGDPRLRGSIATLEPPAQAALNPVHLRTTSPDGSRRIPRLDPPSEQRAPAAHATPGQLPPSAADLRDCAAPLGLAIDGLLCRSGALSSFATSLPPPPVLHS